MANNVPEEIADRAGSITPSDSAANNWLYLYVGGAGNIALVTEGGDTVTLSSLPVGSWVWVRTSLVKSTGTTATNLVGFK